MGDAARGSPPGGEAPYRRGWQLPDDVAAGEVSGSPASGPQRRDEGPRAAPPPPDLASAVPSTLPTSVAGLARAVNVTSVQAGNGTSTTVVTFRLEQYDARAGRTGVVTVRLFGDDALGFVTEGDWVEVAGKAKRGFIKADRAINHTSQAQYSRSGQG